MSNSKLVDVTIKSPNHSGKRKASVTRITPHCVVGQISAESIGAIFSNKSRKASSNYGIGKSGEIGLYVDEINRSWCSSSAYNDNKAITIECACDLNAPYAFNDSVYTSLVNLCVDICRRYNKTKLLWFRSLKATNAHALAKNEMLLTVHRWFSNTACPGDWMYNKMGDLATAVTNILNADATKVFTCPFKVKVNIGNLNIRAGAGTDTLVKSAITKGVYTIVDVKQGKGSNLGWGKLKSGAGWISLDYVTML